MTKAALFDLSGAGWIAARHKNFYVEFDGAAFDCRVAHFGVANSHRVFGYTPETSPVTVMSENIVVIISSPELADGSPPFRTNVGLSDCSPVYSV